MSQKKSRKEKKIRIRSDLYEWIEHEIGTGRFWSFSHAAEAALIALRGSEQRN